MSDVENTLMEDACDLENAEEKPEECSRKDKDELALLKKELEGLKNELAERDRLERMSERMNSELAEFRECFPNSTLEEIPDEIWEKVKRGASLPAEYSLYVIKAENERRRISSVNERNRKMSAGAIGFAEGEKYFSPEEVKKMSPAQVKKHYDDIIESMRHWN